MKIEEFLSRLDGVKSRGKSKWMARCPAHDDRDPSLSITESRDGKILLHCWTGCSALDVVHAVGLALADLFPEKPDYSHPMAFAQKEMRQREQRNNAIYRDRLVVALAYSDVKAGKHLTRRDFNSLRAAQSRLKAKGVDFDGETCWALIHLENDN